MSPPEDRYCESAGIGAGHAATALAKLFDCTVLMEPPRCHEVSVSSLKTQLEDHEDWAVAIFADFTGAVKGQAGLLFSRGVVHEVLLHLVDTDPPGDLDERCESALAETGNIALSAAGGALGDLFGGIVMPSVPRLSFDMPNALIQEALRPTTQGRAAYLAETQLQEVDGPLRLGFVWIPEE